MDFGYWLGIVCFIAAACLGVAALRNGKATKKQKRPEVNMWLLVESGGTWQLRPAKNSTEDTVWCDGINYPREFLRPLGRDAYMVPTAFLMPKDGSLAHPGDLPDSELMPVPHHEYIAHWRTFWAGTRRIIWGKIWQRTDGSTAFLKNMASSMIIVAAFLMIWSTWGLRSRVDSLAASAANLAGQLSVTRAEDKQPAGFTQQGDRNGSTAAQEARPQQKGGAATPVPTSPFPPDNNLGPVDDHSHPQGQAHP